MNTPLRRDPTPYSGDEPNPDPAARFAATFINKGGGTRNGRPLSDYTPEEQDAYWAAFHANSASAKHAQHMKQTVSAMTCEPCRTKKIRWMLAQPSTSHARRNGENLAARHGVEPE